MKKYFLLAVLTSIALTTQAQKIDFSVVGGVQNAAVQGDLITNGFKTGTSYYIGLGSDFSFSDRSSIYSELTYSNIKGTSYFQLPVMFKYRFSEKSSFLAGPQIGFASDDRAVDVEGFSIGLSGGYQYDFSDKLYGMVRYTHQLNDHYSGPISITHTIDMASIGIGFKF